MKKVAKKVGISIIVVSVLLCIGLYFWDGLFSSILPWTRTSFRSYESYINLLDNHHFLASYRFIDEIPANATLVKYYCHRHFKKKYAAHSIVLAEEDYERITRSQMLKYYERCNENTSLVYQIQENECWKIDDMKKAGIDIDFISNVMHNPDEQEEYYCLIDTRIGRVCHTGVVVNDTTHEMIEFSVQLPLEE